MATVAGLLLLPPPQLAPPTLRNWISNHTSDTVTTAEHTAHCCNRFLKAGDFVTAKGPPMHHPHNGRLGQGVLAPAVGLHPTLKAGGVRALCSVAQPPSRGRQQPVESEERTPRALLSFQGR